MTATGGLGNIPHSPQVVYLVRSRALAGSAQGQAEILGSLRNPSKTSILGEKMDSRTSAWPRAGAARAQLSTCGLCETFATPPVAISDLPEVPQGQ